MKKLNFNLGEHNKLSKEQMKSIAGGFRYCIYYSTGNPGCGYNNGANEIDADEFANDCAAQSYWDNACANHTNCCESVDCGCVMG